MPSGAKKRKAAKKKKENQPNNESRASSASTHSHGEEEVKHQEDDIEDVTSILRKEELIDKEMSVSNPSSAEGSRIDNGEKRVVAEEGIVPVERNFKIADGLDGKDGAVEHYEAKGNTYSGGSSGSSSSRSSSSDDENHGIGENSKAAGDIDIPSVVHSLSGMAAEDIPISTIGEPDRSVDLEKISASAKGAEVGTVCPQGISGAPYEVESVMKENEEERLIHVDEEGENSLSSTKAASEREDCEIVHSVDSTAATNDLKEYAALENDYRLSVPQNAPMTTAGNQAEHERDRGITEKTSWKSCCGLFDVFSASGA